MAKNKSISIRKIASYLFIQTIFLLFIIFTFRRLRELFPLPNITDNEIIGYAQYFGYPLYFDNFIFFLVMLSPIIICFVIQRIVR